MDLVGALMPHALSFGLVFSRVAGFVAASPFPGNHVAVTQRVGLTVCLSWLASSVVRAPSLTLDARCVVSAAVELGCGVVLGLAFRFVFAAAEVLGQNLSQATGLSAPSVLNPTLEAQDAPLARALGLFAMYLALALGAHRVGLAYLFASFRTLPPGASMAFENTAVTFVDLAAQALSVGLRLSLPVAAVALAVQVALAMVSRAAPSLQLFSVGLTVLVAAGAAVLLASAGDLATGLAEHLATLAPRLDALLTALRPSPP
ncbi:MAG: flagellar biosynthetic protein FliR [Deltaproteobacteria bacterium]|nr:flagellar biosynthetic protein FliR [Deltaproteobacteria bacterium]